MEWPAAAALPLLSPFFIFSFSLVSRSEEGRQGSKRVKQAFSPSLSLSLSLSSPFERRFIKVAGLVGWLLSTLDLAHLSSVQFGSDPLSLSLSVHL